MLIIYTLYKGVVGSVIFVSENENGEKRENNEFVNENENAKTAKLVTQRKC